MSQATVAAPRTLRLGLVLPELSGTKSSPRDDVASGVGLALTETQRAGQLFGQNVEMRDAPISEDVLTIAKALVEKGGVTVIIGGLTASGAASLGQYADQSGVVFLNVGATADSLRSSPCHRHMFHIAPSDAMISSAHAAVESSAVPPFSIELWHSSLERYGGSQLNDRYSARFHRAMSSPAWAGWVAVKIAWEASLRARSTDPTALVDFLEKDAAQFDGHKGTPLNFRSWDHQLRQPLYAVSRNPQGERVVAELPDVGKASTGSMRDQLDRFGSTAASGRCFPEGVR